MFLKFYVLQPLLFSVIVPTLLFMILSYFFFIFSLSDFIRFFCFSYSSGGSQTHSILSFRLPAVSQETSNSTWKKNPAFFPKFVMSFLSYYHSLFAFPLVIHMLSFHAVISAGLVFPLLCKNVFVPFWFCLQYF